MSCFGRAIGYVSNSKRLQAPQMARRRVFRAFRRFGLFPYPCGRAARSGAILRGFNELRDLSRARYNTSMKIIDKPLAEIRPYENNPRRNDGAVDAVAASIKEFGWKVPIVVDRDGVIVAGHTRYKAAKKLGMISAPCIVADDLTPDQVRAFRVADNKTAELAEWDMDALAEELKAIALSPLDIDMEAFGFNDDDLGYGTKLTAEEAHEGKLAEKFGVAPFSVLDARQGSWQERKVAWLALGMRSVLGRGGGKLETQGSIARQRSYSTKKRTAKVLRSTGLCSGKGGTNEQ
jgi:hypothetical protein